MIVFCLVFGTFPGSLLFACLVHKSLNVCEYLDKLMETKPIRIESKLIILFIYGKKLYL